MVRPSLDTPSAPLDELVAAVTHGFGSPPGALLAVSHAGQVMARGAGAAQAFGDDGPICHPPDLGLDTATDLGSVTKLVATTASLMALHGFGILTLQERLETFLPWTASTPAGGATLTQLLEHRAGLWEWWPLYLDHDDDPDGALRGAAERPLRYRPDEARRYSDLGFILLGAVVAAVAGADLPSAVAQLVLEPIQLTATRYAAPVPGAQVAASSVGDGIEREMIRSGIPYPVDGDADAFGVWREHVLVGEVNDGNAFHALGSLAGHAGLFSTARDLLRFGDELLARHRGEGVAAERDAIARFLTPSTDPAQALGFRRWELPGGPAWGHTGFPGIGFAILPRQQATVVLVTNRLHVAGPPRPTEPMWLDALHAAERHLATIMEMQR